MFLLVGTFFMYAGLTSLIKNPINATEATQGFILTTEGRLIKILACNANSLDYTSEGVTDATDDD